KALMRKVGTIVFIKPSDRYPAGHYLLRVASGWMDPWINLPSVAPARAGIRKRLPGAAQWVLFRIGSVT
ncbi:MAG: hypothetical protein ABIH41_04145, partial [Nanoarchaeota archaeon]